MSYIIVGLGNPGEEYKKTRHNAGRIIVNLLQNNPLDKGGLGDLVPKLKFITPDTFMNLSGKAVAPLITSEKKAEKLIVIYDDLDLPLGTMKLSFDRSSGGHRGVESIIKAIKTQKFIRFRIGISPVTASGKLKKPIGEEKVTARIMGEFKKDEMDLLKKQAKKISEAVQTIMSDGLAHAMTGFN